MDDKIEESTNILNLIQKEKDQINNSLNNVIEEINLFFNKMKNELETQVKKVNDKLKLFVKRYNNEIELSKKISEEAKQYNYQEKNNLKLLSYISKLDKTCENMDNLMSEQIYSLKYTFDINNKEIIYEEKKINNIDKKYSYLCINKIDLKSFITKGTENTEIEIILKNDGKTDWEPNTKLIFDNNSQIKSDDIILNPQKCNEEQTYKIHFKDLSKLNVGKYECYLWFNINGENFGEKIKFMIKVNENENSNIVEIFRETFLLSKSDFSDKNLIEVLKRAENDMELAFSYLFE